MKFNIQDLTPSCYPLLLFKFALFCGAFVLYFICEQSNGYKIMTTTNSATVRCRITPEVKGQAEEILASIGMSTSDAMRLFLKQVVIRGEFPIELKVPNQKTINAFKEKNLESVDLQELRDM